MNSQEATATASSIGGALAWACRRDLLIAHRSRAEVVLVMVFYVLIASLFPLATSPQATMLRGIGPGIVWVCALLAILLSLPRLFSADFADGTLEQMLLSPAPLPALIAGKVLAHWLATCLPLLVLTPLLGLQYGLESRAVMVLAAALLLGTPVLVWFGAITAALTLGARGGGALLALLVLPLAVPVLVFGAGAVDADNSGIGASAHLSLLGAGLLLTCVIGPFVTALAVKIGHE